MPGDDRPRDRKTHDGKRLADLLGDIVSAELEAREWSEQTAEMELGIAQSTLNRITSRQSNLKLETLDQVLDGFEEGPVEFFLRHPTYKGQAPPRDPDEAMLIDLLKKDELKLLLEAVRELKRLRAFDEAMEVFTRLPMVAKAGRRRRAPDSREG